jgi:hypothetical protein
MRIAFYAPLKPPGHPTPSGDRLMARMLVEALRRAGHRVALVSDLRSFAAAPSAPAIAALQKSAAAEIGRLRRLWSAQGAPDLWLSYHP